jgi:hypothetical protein
MSTLYAFINQEYFKAWCQETKVEPSFETQLEFMKQYGTPIIQYIDPQSDNFVTLEKGYCVHINFNYYTELRRRFPTLVLGDTFEQEIASDSIFRSILRWVMNTLSKTKYVLTKSKVATN